MKYLCGFLCLLLFPTTVLFPQSTRQNENAEIIKSILEDRVPVKKYIPASPKPFMKEEPASLINKEIPIRDFQSKDIQETTARPLPTTEVLRSTPSPYSQGKAPAKGQNPFDAPQPAGSDRALLDSAINSYESGNIPSALDKFRQIRTRFPSSKYIDQSSIWIAKSLVRDGKNSEALTELARVNEDTGEYPYALYLSGQIYRIDRKFESAIDSFTKIYSRYPGNELSDDALIEAGKIYLLMNNGQMAMNAAVQVVKSYPDRENLDDAYFLIGTVLEKDPVLRDIEKAYLVFKKFVYRAEVEKIDSFRKSPLLSRVKQEIHYLEKNFLKGR